MDRLDDAIWRRRQETIDVIRMLAGFWTDLSPLRICRAVSLRLEVRMPPKYHHTPRSGGDRKALKKELVRSRAMTKIFAERSAEKRREGEALIREADNLSCQSWNERMWSDGGHIDPSPTVDQAINGGFAWLEIE
jgi:hypothetical protein